MPILLKRILMTAALGIFLFKCGETANHYVVNHNDGRMPVWVINDDLAASFADDPRHDALTGTSQDKMLCDIFVLPELTPEGLEYNEIASLGDLFIWTGRSLIILSEILCILWPILWLVEKFGVRITRK